MRAESAQTPSEEIMSQDNTQRCDGNGVTVVADDVQG